MTTDSEWANVARSHTATPLAVRSLLAGLLCLAALGTAPTATAQPAAPQVADSLALISLDETVFTTYSTTNAATSVSYSFRVGDGPEQSAGFTGGGLRPALASSPEALAELDRFRRKRTQSVIGGAVLLAGVVAAGLTINEPTGERVFDPRTGRNEPKNQLNPVGLIPLGVGIAGLIYAGANYTGSSRHIQRAVALYNDGVAGRGRTALAVAPSLGLSGPGVQLSLSW